MHVIKWKIQRVGCLYLVLVELTFGKFHTGVMFSGCSDLLSIPFGFRHNPGFAEHSTTRGSPNRSVDRSVGYYGGGQVLATNFSHYDRSIFEHNDLCVCERSLLQIPKGNSCDLCLFTCVPRTHEAPHSSANCSGLPRKSAFGGNYLEFGTRKAEERESVRHFSQLNAQLVQAIVFSRKLK